uniref:Cytochrome P450 n=1 Tax=Oryza barthii TaxID=65489 RepID=A0A0D3GDY5_9ORYZ
MSVGDKWSGVYGSADGEAFRRTLDEAFEVSGAVSNVGEWVPLLGWLDVQGFRRRMKRLSKMYDRFLEQILHEHEASMAAAGDGGQPAAAACDLVDVLLQLSGEEEEGSAGAGADSEARLTRDGVKAFILDIIAGGTESSAVTMEWAMAELLRCPDAIATATDELDRVVGWARWVAESDLPDLPYVDAVVKEALRLHPVGPLLVPHHAMEDTVAAVNDVPVGTHVLVNVWAIARNPTSWPDRLDVFLPERFLPGGGADGVPCHHPPHHPPPTTSPSPSSSSSSSPAIAASASPAASALCLPPPPTLTSEVQPTPPIDLSH